MCPKCSKWCPSVAREAWHLLNLLLNTRRISGAKVIGISGSLIWSKTLMELRFNSCGEFRWCPEGPVSQIHSFHLLVGAPGIFSDLLRFVQMLKRVGVRKATGSYRTYSSLVKLQSRFLSLQWKTCLWNKLHAWCLSLQWRTCPWAEHLWWWWWWWRISAGRETWHLLNTLLNNWRISAAEIVKTKRGTHVLITAEAPVRLIVPRNGWGRQALNCASLRWAASYVRKRVCHEVTPIRYFCL